MEALGKNVCVDTSTIIEFIKGRDKKFIGALEDGRKICTTSICAFELSLRKTNIEVVEHFLGRVSVLPFDDLSAKIASNLIKSLKEKGKTMEIRDLFIAAICIRNSFELLTENRKHFEHIKELKLA